MQEDEREIRELVARWMKSTQVGDIDTVLDLMAEDVVFLRPGHPPMIGRAAFAAAARPQAGPTPQFDGTSEIQEITICGDWAYMWSKLTVVVTPPGGGASSTRVGHTLSIFARRHGRWVLARDANMLSPAPN